MAIELPDGRCESNDVLDALHRATCAFVEPPSRLRHRKAAGRPEEERRTELLLEVRQLPAHRRHRHVEAAGRRGKAARVDDTQKRRHRVEHVHPGSTADC